MQRKHKYQVLGISHYSHSDQILSWDGVSCAIWSLLSGKQEAYWEIYATSAVATVADGSAITVGGSDLSLWQVKAGTAIETVRVDLSSLMNPNENLSMGLAVSQNMTEVYVSVGQKIIYIDLNDNAPRFFPPYHYGVITQLVLSQSGDTLYSVGLPDVGGSEILSQDQHIIGQWNTRTHSLEQTFVGGQRYGVPRLAIDPCNNWLVIVERGIPIRCLSLRDGAIHQASFSLNESAVGISFQQDGEKFAVLAGDLWIFSCPGSEMISHVPALGPTDYAAYGCALLKDGTFVYANRNKGTLYRLNSLNGSVVSQIELSM